MAVGWVGITCLMIASRSLIENIGEGGGPSDTTATTTKEPVLEIDANLGVPLG
ncbi:hypothetical protein Syun_012876 [Stephania yunnanensis]|uniref:Uncharacterized protein n=1 Tax=Stephania yunnanensis TaxID=152371 RepID=A0AAP0K0D5_9MAGN